MIVIVLMIKNEAASIAANLTAFAQNGFNKFFILDTGSNDATVTIVKDWFKSNEINGQLVEEPFIDFASSRNRALILAKDFFQEATFLLMPDAEWYLRNANLLIEFCLQEQFKSDPLYYINIKSQSLLFTTARLFRTQNLALFKGEVHEAPDCVVKKSAPAETYFEVIASSNGIEKSKQRWLRDKDILLKALKKNPQDPRTLFYLAQTYECLGDLDNAYKYYLHRQQNNGWDEENFITLYRLGRIALAKSQSTTTCSWNTAMDYFLAAFSMRPHRIEPIVQIADYYWPSNIEACYLFINYTYHLPFPSQDKLFIEKEMYDYTRYEIMSRCAWYMGQYNLGIEATERALAVHPQMEHLQNNLKLYQEGIICKTL
ncbi:MAG: hypothetical protein A3F18_05975 [Legionellales bacterium RIFCSPHIGHO2_12_FULL_37_14]|nr:MAG: hypothetical protein A3F18_05975 [Legionellales bacterium RIFCSPHIGHO2_12_FULL_37_14]